MAEEIRKRVDAKLLRDIPGWDAAPVPVCMGGDVRALTFCCKPGSTLTFGYKCKRDQRLKEIGLSPEEFVRIKEVFSMQEDWGSSYPCFDSLSYCCMRRGGCFRRDTALAQRYPDLSQDEVLHTYFAKKRVLARLLLEAGSNREKVKFWLEFGI